MADASIRREPGTNWRNRHESNGRDPPPVTAFRAGNPGYSGGRLQRESSDQPSILFVNQRHDAAASELETVGEYLVAVELGCADGAFRLAGEAALVGDQAGCDAGASEDADQRARA